MRAADLAVGSHQPHVQAIEANWLPSWCQSSARTADAARRAATKRGGWPRVRASSGCVLVHRRDGDVSSSGHNEPISKATLLRNRGSVEVSLGERAARAGLQIALEPSGRLLVSELDHHMEIPGAT